MDFNALPLHAQLLSNISSLGFQTPTPIQQQTLPYALAGKDVVGLAETGSGKTAAFALPILQKLLSQQQGKKRMVQALVIAPTRELADQIFNSFGELGRGSGLRGTCLYGGMPIRPQLRALRDGVDVVVGCPGRILDHIQQGSLDLSHVDVLVLDEADHMFDMGFLPTVQRILKQLPRNRQTLLFSATMPKEVAALAKQTVTDPVTVKVGKSGLSTTVSHSLYTTSDSQKNALLLSLIADVGDGSTIVFTRTKRRAQRLGELMLKAGTSAASLQGNLSQSKRRDAIDGFRQGRYRVLVATDIAARGIDVSRVSHVVNYDMPDTVEAYTHRTGRTGRATRSGDAISFVTSSDQFIVRRIERDLRLQIQRLTLPATLPAVPAASLSASEPRSEQRSDARRSYRRSSSKSFSRSPRGSYSSSNRRSRAASY